MQTKAVKADASGKRGSSARPAARKTTDPNAAFDSPWAPGFAIQDIRPAAVPLRNLQRSIDGSPRQRAQAAQISGLFGLPMQQAEGVEALQTVAAPAAPQSAENDEDKALQGKFDPAAATAQLKPGTAGSGNRPSTPDQLKPSLEVLFGMDLSDVRVHRDSPRPA